MQYKTEFGVRNLVKFGDLEPGELFRVGGDSDYRAPLMKTRVGEAELPGFVHFGGGTHCQLSLTGVSVVRIRIARVDADGVPVFVDA